MANISQLRVTDYDNENRWRWVLEDDRGKFLADHEVDLTDDTSEDAQAFRDLTRYLHYYRGIKKPEQVLPSLGAWMDGRIFGAVGEKLTERLTPPATVVRVSVPRQAQGLLAKPFELAHLKVKRKNLPLAEAGVRFVYHLDDAPQDSPAKPTADAFRVLAVFSLPHGENPLSLRRERVELEKLLEKLAQTRARAVELRVLQYGATREIFKDALEEAAGWDLIHISGHGLQGELVLEDETGEPDRIDDEGLAKLLRNARQRLHLLTLSTCLSGAASVRAARRQVGLDPPRRETATEERTATEVAEKTVETKEADAEEVAAEALAASLPVAAPLPSLGQSLARELDCAVLAMRYSVGDDFAREVVLALYEKLLGKEQPLPAALQLALDEALEDSADTADAFPLSRITPILFGPRAAGLVLKTPKAEIDFEPPTTGLLGFPDPPERFVGRVRPMQRASAALAPESPHRGVLFHGMAGGGKTACALELAYRHERNRFTGMAWWKAPDEDQEIAGALTDFALKLETQLPGLALVGLMDDPEDVRLKVVPRLRGLLQQRAILLVLDNLESLLTSKGDWRDERWGALIPALLDHNGTSRVVLTSRRVPKDLAGEERLQIEPIHALSFPESVLLARELPGLSQLFATPEGRKRLRRLLAAAQGHPKLLELADGVAQKDLNDLDKLVGGSAKGEEEGDEVRAGGRFFTEGETDQDVAAFVEELEGWTIGISAGLPATARLLFHFLCCLEEEDRVSGIVEANWKDFLNRLGEDVPVAVAALAEEGEGLKAGLERLSTAGLVEVERPPKAAAEQAPGPRAEAVAGARLLRLHPAVAEAGRKEAGDEVSAAVDREMGDFWVAVFAQAYKDEMQGAGGAIATAGPRAAPYLMRAERWQEASTLLEQSLARDSTPATVATALPLLRQIARATKEMPLGFGVAGVLTRALLQAGRLTEAEVRLREQIARAAAQGAYRQASAQAGDLINLLLATGHPEEALGVAERKAAFTRRAGLGPWTQLADEARRLQLLNALGRYREVLDEVERLRTRMEKLPETSEAEEAVDPWNVRETLLDTGRFAARDLEDWQAALELSTEIMRSKEDRGAGEVELAATRFNLYGPLLNLGRFAAARTLLEACRRTFEAAGQVASLGKVLSALADLEGELGNPAAAVGFEEVALRYKYQAEEPEACAISHHNLANYLEKGEAEAEAVLAHRLAAGAIRIQISSGLLGTTLHNLAHSPLPPEPPTFDEVVAQVEEIDGVRFGELFERLPRKAPDGDAAIAEVWRLVGEMRAEMQAGRERAEAALAAAPAAVREAIEAGDFEALNAAMKRLPEEEEARVAQSLGEAGVLRAAPAARSGPDMDQLLRNFDPLLRGIAVVARGHDEPREEIEEALPKMEENGWRLTDAVHRIWKGERDAEVLTAEVDPNSAQLIRRILELIEQPTYEEALAAAPAPVREAIVAGDVEALNAALEALPEEEAGRVLQSLQEAGVLGAG